MRNVMVLVLIPAAAVCQRPVINPEGVVNAATLAPLGLYHGIAPGSIFTIFGRDLAEKTETATSVPLPRKLGGAEVLLEGAPVPLFYVSPTQINAQMPNGLMGGAVSTAPKPLVVRTAAGVSDAVLAKLAPHGLGIFTLDASGCGPGTVFNVGPDGSLSLNSPDNPVAPEGVLTIFGTGFGEARNSIYGRVPPTGEPAPLDVPLPPIYQVGYQTITRGSNAVRGWVLYSGRAPGWIGLDQFNTEVPDTIIEGCGVPFRLSSSYSQSQPVPIFVGRDGVCPPLPAPDAFGSLSFQRIETVSRTATTVTEELVVDLSEAIAKEPPREPHPRVGGCEGVAVEYTSVPRGPSCQGFEVFYGRSLDAGAITVSGPGFGPLRFEPVLAEGRPVYRIPLPAGAIRAGEFTVTAAGGAHVGAFQVSTRIPASIEVTSTFPPFILPSPQPVVTWRGGDADSVVRARLISRTGPFRDIFIGCVVKASEGSVRIPVSSSGGYVSFGLPATTNDGEIRVRMGAEGDQVQRFTAAGLSLGGALTWLYEKRFTGLGITPTLPLSW